MSPATSILSRVAPLGLRFTDRLTGLAVTNGLQVDVTIPGRESVQATPNGSGTVWVVHHLPGLEAAESGLGDDDYWDDTLPTAVAARVDVTDPLGRFLPTTFETTVPHRGALGDPCGTGAHTIALFPAAHRPSPPGLASVRAELHDVRNDRPAAWAVLTVSVAGRDLATGMADADGRLLISFGFPDTAAAIGVPAPALSDQTWPLDLILRYRPAAGPITDRPAFCAAQNQPAGLLLARPTSNQQAFPAPTLRMGQELILRSTDTSALLCRPNP